MLSLFFMHFAAQFVCLLWLMRHKVDSVELLAPAVVTGENGGSVMISCKYNPVYRNNTKYWCKGKIYELCKIVVKTPRNRPNPRSTIADDKDAGVFTVTMTSLTKNDAGQYWCVISTSGRNVHAGVKLLISRTGIPTGTLKKTLKKFHQM